MTRSRKTLYLNLAQFIASEIDGPVRNAVADGGGKEAIADAISTVLLSAKVQMRVRNASPGERESLQTTYLPKLYAELQALGAEPPVEVREDGALRIEGFDDAASQWPALAAPDMEARFEGVEPEAIAFLVNKTAVRVTTQADDALKTAAGDGETPTQMELSAWISDGCSKETLREVADRLASLWDLPPEKVAVTGWAYGGLTVWRDGKEWHAPAGQTFDEAEAANVPNPLRPLVRDWQKRPFIGNVNDKTRRIMPGKVAMVDPGDRRAGKLFSVAAHVSQDVDRPNVLPGFEVERSSPALPLALYDLGADNHRSGGGATPLALRLWVEALLSTSFDERSVDRPIVLRITMRDLRERLWPKRPGKRQLKSIEVLDALDRAAEVMQTNAARIPWYNPETGRGGRRQVVSVIDLPRHKERLDDFVKLEVNLPPGSGPGPQVSEALALWGLRRAPAYRALLNLAYSWYEPGKTSFHPKGARGNTHVWMQSPEKYPELTDQFAVEVCFPSSTTKNRRVLAQRARAVLRELELAGELATFKGHVMPVEVVPKGGLQTRMLPAPKGQ